MSLTLNDEQEKALREFWSAHYPAEMASPAKQYATAAHLLGTVRPLMQPWRVEGKGVVVSDSGCAYCTHQRGGSESPGLARRICDLLNESEGL